MTTPPYDGSATEPVSPAPPPPAAAPPQPTAAPPRPAVQPSPFAPPEPMPVVEPVTRDRSRAARGGSGRLVNLALGAAVVIAIAGVAFAAGRATAPPGSTGTTGAVTLPGDGDGGFGDRGLGNGGLGPDGSFAPGQGQLPGTVRGQGLFGSGAGLTIAGSVDAVTADSLTIKLEDGRTITVGLSDDTTYHRLADAGASDVTPGTSVQLRLTGGFRPDGGSTGSTTLGTASDVTIVP